MNSGEEREEEGGCSHLLGQRCFGCGASHERERSAQRASSRRLRNQQHRAQLCWERDTEAWISSLFKSFQKISRRFPCISRFWGTGRRRESGREKRRVSLVADEENWKQIESKLRLLFFRLWLWSIFFIFYNAPPLWHIRVGHFMKLQELTGPRSRLRTFTAKTWVILSKTLELFA